MKKITLAFILAIASICTIKAQQNQADSVIYILGTSFFSDEKVTGFTRRTVDTTDDPQLYLGPIYAFYIRSTEKNANIVFWHCNYNLTELAKRRRVFPGDSMETRIRPLSELATYANVVDVAQLIATKTQEEMWQWAKFLKGKRKFIIDRNDFFVENGVEKMKLIQVGVIHTNEPEESDDEGVLVE